MDSARSGRTVLAAIGREIGGLGVAAERLQDVLSPALSQSLMANPHAIAGLQDLDRLTQTLHALEGIALRLADLADERWTVELEAVLGASPLADLNDRLRLSAL